MSTEQIIILYVKKGSAYRSTDQSAGSIHLVYIDIT